MLSLLQVIWHFVDHNQTISTGDEIRASAENYIQKYTIYRPAGEKLLIILFGLPNCINNICSARFGGK